MYLRDESKHSIQFFLTDPKTQSEVRLSGKSIRDVVNMVISQMSEFDRVTSGGYTKKAKDEAKSLNLQFTNYINKLIQHQMCVRMHPTQRATSCYNSGLGDKLHSFAGKIDDVIESMPSGLRSVGQAVVRAATKLATGKAQKRMGGCSSCGGTRRFDPDAKRNMGRAAKKILGQ